MSLDHVCFVVTREREPELCLDPVEPSQKKLCSQLTVTRPVVVTQPACAAFDDASLRDILSASD
jgi:hypothetical protein